VSEPLDVMFGPGLRWMAKYGPGEKCYACGREPNDPPHELLHRFGEALTGHLQHFVECEATLNE